MPGCDEGGSYQSRPVDAANSRKQRTKKILFIMRYRCPDAHAKSTKVFASFFKKKCFLPIDASVNAFWYWLWLGPRRLRGFADDKYVFIT
jgi:hypothetical protein